MLEYTYKTPDQRLKDAASLMIRSAVNQAVKCVVPGCLAQRYSVGRYCRRHKDKVARTGHPTRSQPRGEVWEKLVAEGEAALSSLPSSRWERTDIHIGVAARKLFVPASDAITAIRVYRTMTKETRARIVLAWLLHKRNWKAERIVRLCLCVMRWVKLTVDDCGPSDRARFAAHILGARLIQHAHVVDVHERYQRRREANPSWANHPYREIEEIVTVREYARFGPSVSKALGMLVQTVVNREVGMEWVEPAS